MWVLFFVDRSWSGAFFCFWIGLMCFRIQCYHPFGKDARKNLWKDLLTNHSQILILIGKKEVYDLFATWKLTKNQNRIKGHIIFHQQQFSGWNCLKIVYVGFWMCGTDFKIFSLQNIRFKIIPDWGKRKGCDVSKLKWRTSRHFGR